MRWLRCPRMRASKPARQSAWDSAADACLLASMIAPLAWMQAVTRLGPSRTTQFFNLLPLLTALIAALVLGEQLALYHLVGGGLTLAGVILSERWNTPLGRAR